MNLIDEKERRVLEALYARGESTVSAIAKETLLNRTALYHTVQKLLKKGLITQVEKEKISYFQPISIEEFEKWSEKKIADSEAELGKDLQKFKSLHTSDRPTLFTDVKYFEGHDGMRSLYYDTLRDNKEKTIRSITDYEKGYACMKDFFEDEYILDRLKKNISVKSIVPEGAFNRMYHKKGRTMSRDMVFIDIFKDLGIEVNVYNDKVAIVAFDEKHPVGVIIKNQIISQAFKEIFGYLWRQKSQGK